jgi:anti-sigma B factor antagonist
MDIETTHSGGVRIARLSGDFDIGDEEQMGKALQPLVAEPNSRVAVDLSELKQINSQGLGQLIDLVMRGRLNRSRVLLVAPTPFVKGVLEVTRLDQWFEIVDGVNTAVKSFEEAPES